MMFFHITYDDGNKKIASAFKLRGNPPSPGDVLVAKKPFYTPVHSYNVGDELHLMCRTQEAPHHILCSLGNWVVKCKYQVSIWSNVEWALAEGILEVKPKEVCDDTTGNNGPSDQGRV